MAVNDSSRTLAGPTPPPRLLFAGWTTHGAAGAGCLVIRYPWTHIRSRLKVNKMRDE